MLKKSITYKDLDGNDVTDDFYFQLNETEILELEIKYPPNGLNGLVEQLIAAEDGAQIIMLFKEIIGLSIGKRSPDGKRFVKNQDIRDEFFQSDAYNQFFMELLNDPKMEKGAAFIRGIVPAHLAGDISANGKPTTDVVEVPAYIRENREPTPDELKAMTPDQLQEAFRRKTAQN